MIETRLLVVNKIGEDSRTAFMSQGCTSPVRSGMKSPYTTLVKALVFSRRWTIRHETGLKERGGRMFVR